MHKPDLSGRLINWSIELSQLHLTYVPRTAIKAQALADFVVECVFSETTPDPNKQPMATDKSQEDAHWKLYVYFEVLNAPAIQERTVMEIDPPAQTWMTVYVQYLENDTFPENKVKAKQIRVQATK